MHAATQSFYAFLSWERHRANTVRGGQMRNSADINENLELQIKL